MPIIQPLPLLDVPFASVKCSDDVKAFLHDEAHLFQGKASKVFFPLNEEEVSAILKEANSKTIPVTISGGGTGLTGARVPLEGWIIATDNLTHPMTDGGTHLVFEDAGRSFSFYKKKDVIRAPCAVTLAQLQNFLAQHQLFYGPDPTEISAFLGSTLATNASGARSFRHGPTRAWVQGLRVILPTGEAVEIQRGTHIGKDFTLAGKTFSLPDYISSPTLKNAAGFHITQKPDLVDLFIGSEGTLGVITAVDLRVITPPSLIGIVAYFEEYSDLRMCLERLRPEATSLEYLDAASLRMLRESFSSKIPSLARCALIIETPQLDTIAALLDVCMDTWVAQTAPQIEEQKKFRHALPENINTLMRSRSFSKFATDFSVPWQKLDEMMHHYNDAMTRFGGSTVLFGHIGSAHLHLNFLCATQAEQELAKDIMLELAKKAVALGGSVAAEHGVGKKRLKDIPLLELMYPKDAIHQMKQIKQTLDPKMLLNQGNLFP